MRRMRRLAVLLAVLSLAFVSCSALRDPREPWEASVQFQERDGKAVAVPDRVRVEGPYGFLEVTNFTHVRRGFAIDELAVYEEIKGDSGTRITVREARDGRSYRFYDHLNPDGPRGQLVVRYVAEEDR